MLTTEERQFEFVGLVQSMRTAQKEFFKSRDQTVLEDAKYYERQVDRALKRLRHGEPSDA
jgi:hypothetical protein